jgi:hypothetical protein
MSYCSLDEAWGNNNMISEKRKRRAPIAKEESPSSSSATPPIDSRSFSRDIKTQKDFNGPEERYHVEPIKIEEDFSSQHENIENVYKPAEFEKQFVSKNNSSITSSEMEWIKEQLEIITNKLANMNANQSLNSSLSSSSSSGDEKGNPVADIFLYLSTGFLTIFLIDILLKKRN